MAKIPKELLNDPFNDGSLTGSFVSDNMWIKWALFVSLGLFCLLIISIIVSWLLRLLDVKSPKTSVDMFEKASKVDIYLCEDEKITLKPGSENFTKFISFFSDAGQDNVDNLHFVKANVFIDFRKYTLNFSNEGWNFAGESRNSKCLNNPLGLILFLEKLEEEENGR